MRCKLGLQGRLACPCRCGLSRPSVLGCVGRRMAWVRGGAEAGGEGGGRRWSWPKTFLHGEGAAVGIAIFNSVGALGGFCGVPLGVLCVSSEFKFFPGFFPGGFLSPPISTLPLQPCG